MLPRTYFFTRHRGFIPTYVFSALGSFLSSPRLVLVYTSRYHVPCIIFRRR